MKYITGIHALNIPCKLDTCGDWHCSALKWEKVAIEDTEKSPFGTYGIEMNKTIPEHSEKFAVANHIRACLDLIEKGDFSNAQGMNEDFIVNKKYTGEIFRQVYKLRSRNDWKYISAFMGPEYKMQWLHFLKKEEG